MAVLGSGFGLALGLFVNAPPGVRMLWRRVPAASGRGEKNQFWQGMGLTVAGLGYFGLVFTMMRSKTTGWMRAGAKLAFAVLLYLAFLFVSQLLNTYRVVNVFDSIGLLATDLLFVVLAIPPFWLLAMALNNVTTYAKDEPFQNPQ